MIFMAEEKKKVKRRRTRKKAETAKEKTVEKAEKKEAEKPAEPVKAVERPAPEKPAPKKRPTRKKKHKKKKPPVKFSLARGKRKRAVARARVKPGKGNIRINSKSLQLFQNTFIRRVIREPLRYLGAEANNIDISVRVRGGGEMGQAQAARTAIANALADYFKELDLRKKFLEIDRSLIVEDTRRVESKKYRGPKARARYQKSYR